MTLRRTFQLILAAAWLAVSAWGQTLILAPSPDLVDSTDSTLLIEGSPALTLTNNVLTFNITTPYFAIYNTSGNYVPAYGSCALPSGAMLALALQGNISVQSSVSASAITTTATNISFTSTTTTDLGFTPYATNGYAPTTFNLTNVPQAKCSVNNSPLLMANHQLQVGEYIEITPVDPAQQVTGPAASGSRDGGGDGDGGWVPIPGNSLKFLASPDANGKQFYFSCTSDYSAELAGLKKVVRLENVRRGRKNELFLSLKGIDDWDITAYPENVRIAPKGGKLIFSVATPYKFQCLPNVHPTNLVVVKEKDPKDPAKVPRPQELVVRWPTTWYSIFTRQYMTVPCGDNLGLACLLQLVTAK